MSACIVKKCLTTNFIFSTANTYQRLMALTHIFHLTTEDACLNAYIYKIKEFQKIFSIVRCWLNERSHCGSLPDVYAYALNELALGATKEGHEDVNHRANEANLGRELTDKLIHLITDYR